MADSTISALPSVGLLDPNALIPLVQSGVTSSVKASQIASLLAQIGGQPLVSVGTGTGDAILASFTPQVSALVNGASFLVRAPAANTVAVPTVSLGSTGAKPIMKGGNSPLQAGDIAGPGHWLELTWDAALGVFCLLNPVYPAVAAANMLLSSVNGGAFSGQRNYVVNGNCRISQRGNVILSASGALYGGCDRFLNSVTGSTVSVVFLRAFVGAGFTASGYAQQFGNVTTTGASAAVLSTRLEGAETAGLQGKTVTMRCRVLQQSGAAQTLTLAARSANNLDDFSSNTLIAASAGQSIPNNVWTTATFTFTHAGGNGTQIDFGFFNLPAQTNSQFYFGDVSLEIGGIASTMERGSIAEDLAQCQRYFLNIASAAGICATSNVVQIYMQYPVPMRATPTLTCAGVIKVTDSTADFAQSSFSATLNGDNLGGYMNLQNFSGLIQFRTCGITPTGSRLNLVAEL